MKRTGRFAVTALGAITLSSAFGAPRRQSATVPMRLQVQTEPAVTWHFDSMTAGQAPAGFSFGRTGGGRVGHWIVQSAPDAPSLPNVLAQVDSDRTDYRFPVAAALSPSFTDGSLSVKCKPVSGHVDRACGLVFRYQDENNYYLTRANALEDNVRFYYVKNGRRIQLANWSGKVTSACVTSCAPSSKGTMWRCIGTARSESTHTTTRLRAPAALAYGPRPTRTPCSTISLRGRGGRDHAAGRFSP